MQANQVRRGRSRLTVVAVLMVSDPPSGPRGLTGEWTGGPELSGWRGDASTQESWVRLKIAL